MKAIVELLYAQGFHPIKELAIARWMVGDISRRNEAYAHYAGELWEMSGMDCRSFTLDYIHSCWCAFIVTN